MFTGLALALMSLLHWSTSLTTSVLILVMMNPIFNPAALEGFATEQGVKADIRTTVAVLSHEKSK